MTKKEKAQRVFVHRFPFLCISTKVFQFSKAEFCTEIECCLTTDFIFLFEMLEPKQLICLKPKPVLISFKTEATELFGCFTFEKKLTAALEFCLHYFGMLVYEIAVLGINKVAK